MKPPFRRICRCISTFKPAYQQLSGILACVTLFWLNELDVDAQSSPSETNQPTLTSPVLTSQGSLTEISIQQIKDRVKEIESKPDLEESIKAQLIEVYRKAGQRLETTRTNQDLLKGFQEAIETGSQMTAKLRTQLQNLAPIDQTKVPADIQQVAATEQLQTRLTQKKAALTVERNRLETLQRRVVEDEARPKKAQTQLSEAKSILTAIQQDLSASTPDSEGPEIDRAKSLLLFAREQSRLSEIAMLQQELLSQPIRLEMTKAEIEFLSQQIRISEARLKLIEKKISELRNVEAEASRLQAEQLRSESIGKHPLVRSYSDELASLAEEIESQTEKIAKTQSRRQKAFTNLEQLHSNREEVNRTLELDGINETLARVLLELRRTLPSQRTVNLDLQSITEERALARLRVFNIERELRQLSDVDATASALVENEEFSPEKPSDKEEVIAELTRIIQLKSEQLKQLHQLVDANLVEINQLELIQRDFSKESSDLARILDENLLWIPNAAILSPAVFKTSYLHTVHLLSQFNLPKLVSFLRSDAKQFPLAYGSFGVVFFGLFGFRQRAIRYLDSNSKRIGKVHADSIKLTSGAGIATILLSAPLAIALGFFGWRLRQHPDDFLNSLSPALIATAGMFFALRLLRAACRPNGIGEVHFRWPSTDLKLARHQLAWFIPLISSLFIVIVFTESLANSSYKQTIGRLAFFAIFVFTAILSQTLLHPRRGIAIGAGPDETWMKRSRFLWRPMGVIISLILIFLAFCGYYYMALALGHRLYESLSLILLSIFAFAFFQRWTIVSQRQLAYKLALERRQSLSKGDDSEAADIEETEAPDLQQEIDLAEVKTQTLDLLRMSIGLLLAVGLWFTWSDIFPALRIFDSFELWPHTVIIDGAEQFQFITLADLLLAILAVIVTTIGARNMPGFLEIFVLQRLPVDQGTRYAIRTLTLYVIVTSGALIALQTIGMSWNSVQWLVAALTVGLGFGLQEIFGNFVSGLIILLERPIRVGDTVTVGTISGVVTQIRMRATTITDWNRKELVVPNKSFITGELVNWSLSDPILRLDFIVGIAYGSDTTLAHQTMTSVCREHPLVLKHPEATVFFVGFGDNSLNFEVRVFVAEATNTARTRITHDLHLAIDKAFREKNISIAFPQRDVHLDTLRPLEVIVTNPKSRDKSVVRDDPSNTGNQTDQLIPPE